MTDDIRFLHVEKEVILIDGQRVGAIRVTNDGNVLTHIRIDEDERGNGYARDAVNAWLETCIDDGFDEAYVSNVNHGATKHIFETLPDKYSVERVNPRSVPNGPRAGPHISSLSYRVDLTGTDNSDV